MRISPCRCEKPGPGRSQATRIPDIGYVSESCYKERKRLGLPLATDTERYIFGDGERYA